MGDARFIAGFLRGGESVWMKWDSRSQPLIVHSVVSNKPCAMTLSMKVAHRDKSEMAQALQQFKSNPTAATDSAASDPRPTEEWETSIAPRFAQEDTNGPDWFTFDKPVLYV